MERSLAQELVIGVGAGYAAGKVMDRVTTEFLERQSEESKAREKDIQGEPSFVKAAERLAGLGGRNIDEEQAKRIGQGIHVGLGVSGGAIAGILTAQGMNPVAAGMLSGLGIWLVIDEGANAVFGLTPPATEFPKETHIRGLVGHVAYGAALGGLIGIANMLFGRRRR